MESDKLLQMLSARNQAGETFFHEVCRVESLALLDRAALWVDCLIPTILNIHNYDGQQCTHLLTNGKGNHMGMMMEILVNLGADINGRERHGGFTPLHLCVLKKNYRLAEWLCKAPGTNLEAENYAGQTPFHLAYKNSDQQMMEILKLAGAECDPPSSEEDSSSESCS